MQKFTFEGILELWLNLFRDTFIVNYTVLPEIISFLATKNGQVFPGNIILLCCLFWLPAFKLLKKLAFTIHRVVGFIINIVLPKSANFETSNSEEIIMNYILNLKRFFLLCSIYCSKSIFPRFWRLNSPSFIAPSQSYVILYNTKPFSIFVKY